MPVGDDSETACVGGLEARETRGRGGGLRREIRDPAHRRSRNENSKKGGSEGVGVKSSNIEALRVGARMCVPLRYAMACDARCVGCGICQFAAYDAWRVAQGAWCRVRAVGEMMRGISTSGLARLSVCGQ